MAKVGRLFVAKLFSLFTFIALVYSLEHTNPSEKCLEAYKTLSPQDKFILYESTGKGFKEWGKYDTCVDKGFEYCMVLFKVDYQEANKNNISLQEEIGICAPTECTSEDIVIIGTNLAKDLLNYLNITKIQINHIYPSCATPSTYGAGAIILFCIIGILFFLLIAGTTLDFYIRYEERVKAAFRQSNYFEVRIEEEKLFDEEGDEKVLVERESMEEEAPKRSRDEVVLDRSIKGFLLCWSALYNGSKLFVPTPGSLRCLNGIRVLSILYIILGHNFAFMNLEALDDLDTLLHDMKDHFLFQIAPAAFYAVDTFFFISALLVTYLTLGEMQKKGRINLVMFYFHRFWRLTPALALLMFFFWQVIPGVSNGPWWNLETSTIATTCHKYWWSTLLYIQNFYPNSMTDECMGWTWYLANDTQFYVLTPICLYLFFKMKKAGWALIIVLILGCLGANLFLSIYYNFTYYFPYYFLEQDQQYFNYLYVKPYARAFPWLVGIGLGFFLHEYGVKFRLGSVSVAIGYFLSFFTFALLIFLPFNDYHKADGYYSYGYWGEAFNVIFISFSRLLWSLALAWLVWACAVGYGGPLNWFLGHDWWACGARLTYSAYLIHPMVIKVYWASITSPMFYSPFYLAVWYIATATIAFASAILVFLTIERPSMNLERIILPHSRG